jgi:hypothetical protein
MKYFIDFEFIEGFKSSYFKLPLSYKQRHFIDLISIGVVAEDGREYYAISNEFNPNDADNWVRENVLYPIMVANGYSKNLSNLHGCLEYDSHAIKRIQESVGKSNKQIAKEVCEFVNHGIDVVVDNITRADCWSKVYYKEAFEYIKEHRTFIPENIFKSGVDGKGAERNRKIIYNQPEFYGYYADYDWILFCSLFGRMIDLPVGFPKYCRDLKQTLDEKVDRTTEGFVPDATFENKLNYAKQLKEYPKEVDEHNALADARWNKKLFDFIKTL